MHHNSLLSTIGTNNTSFNVMLMDFCVSLLSMKTTLNTLPIVNGDTLTKEASNTYSAPSDARDYWHVYVSTGYMESSVTP